MAVVTAGVLILTQSLPSVHASPSHHSHAVAPIVSDPPPSVLAFHTQRPTTKQPKVIEHPVVTHHAPSHHASRFSLIIVDTGADCYVQVTARHGRLLQRTILHGHQHLTFRPHGLNVVVGNAGAVRMSRNGHHFHRAGQSGQVRRLRVK